MSATTTAGGSASTGAAVRARNKRGEGSRLREEIVAAALEILDESGDSAAVTLRAVARRVGISAPSIYPHFSNRQAILLAALQDAYADFDRTLRHDVDGVGEGSVDRLLAMCHGYLDFAQAHPHRYLVMFGGVWNAADDMVDATVARDDVAALGLFLLGNLTQLLEACVVEGQSGSSAPATDAVALWVAMHGLAHQRIVSTMFPWPDHIDHTIIGRLAHLG